MCSPFANTSLRLNLFSERAKHYCPQIKCGERNKVKNTTLFDDSCVSNRHCSDHNIDGGGVWSDQYLISITTLFAILESVYWFDMKNKKIREFPGQCFTLCQKKPVLKCIECAVFQIHNSNLTVDISIDRMHHLNTFYSFETMTTDSSAAIHLPKKI